MSVLCSKTLIIAPEFWKCILRGPEFKILPTPQIPLETSIFDAGFFPSSPTLKLLPPT